MSHLSRPRRAPSTLLSAIIALAIASLHARPAVGQGPPGSSPAPSSAPAAEAPPVPKPDPGSKEAEGPTIEKLEPVKVTRGAEVKISGARFPSESKAIRIQIGPYEVQPTALDETGNWFTFVVPDMLREADKKLIALGSYPVSVTFTTPQGERVRQVPVPGHSNRLRVIPDAEGPLELAKACSPVSYPEKGKFSVSLVGRGFSSYPQDNIPIIDGRGELEVCASADCASCPDDVCMEFDRKREELTIRNLPKAKYVGPLNMRIKVGDAISNPVPITFAGVGRSVPLFIAGGFIILCALAIYLLARHLAGRATRTGNDSYTLWGTLFIDPETQSYSVGKLQLYLWWAAAIFGYVYLTAARSLIQWNLEFAPIPEKLPGIILISSSTGVLAMSITNLRGPKGAGGVKPSWSDFVTVGGLVAAERVQFLVWTLVGVASFLLLVMLRDPANIRDLPAMPDGFLYLMGISSFGYLGGKFVRKPGPVIESIEAVVKSGRSIELRIKGRNLSRDASVRIDDRSVEFAVGTHLDVIEPEERAQEAGYARVVTLQIATAGHDWSTQEHWIKLRNPDGQEAVGVVKALPSPQACPGAVETGAPAQPARVDTAA